MMTRLQLWLPLALVILLCSPLHADKGHSAFKQGVKAEKQNKYDAAFEDYKRAHELNPKNAEYLAAFARLRFYASSEHVHAGQLLFDAGKYPEALAEFQRAVEIDNGSFIAQQELRRTTDIIRKQTLHPELPASPLKSPLAKLAADVGGPVELQSISDTPINLRITENVDIVYKIIGKLAGVNVLFDPEYKPQRIAVELNDVTAREALDMLALQSKTFWQPVSSNTIFVVSDTAGKRKELQANVMTTFYLKNVATPSELQDAANTVKGILDVSRIQLIPNQNAMVIRGTQDQLVLAEKLLHDIDKPKAEVMIDVAVMQVSRTLLRTLGVNPPTSGSVVMTPTGPVASASNGSGSGSGGSSNANSGHFTIDSLGRLNSNNFAVSIPGASASFLASDSNTKLIQNPEIRALDNEKATLKIGDRVPVATGSFSPGIGGAGLSPLVNTQFQYLDVGVNVDITPHIHSDHEVTLKMVLEISSVTGSQDIGGISQPIIGQRRIEHEARLQDGEVNLIGGILEDSESRSLSGYPWLTKVPILKYFFGQEEKDRRQNEIVFAITPHIVRGQELDDQNLRVVDVGTGSFVGLRHHDERPASSNGSTGAKSRSLPARATDSRTNKPVTSAPNPPAALRSPNTASLTPEPSVSETKSPHPSVTADPRPPFRPARSAPTGPVPNTDNATASAVPLPAKQASRAASADPCPEGQHFIGLEHGVVTCAFN
ncbi:MAG TPA: hypothetical protein VMT53_11745 [Terriglobales bacterium]|nr:hypothetical protein [Terriglobales bacterium]